MEKRLYRSKKDQIIAGVCGGLGEYFNIDPTIIRLLWLLSIFVFGVGIFLYIIAAIIIPEDESQTYIEPNIEDEEYNEDVSGKDKGSVNKEKSEKSLGYGLIIIGIILMLQRLNIFRMIDFRTAFPVLLILVGLVVIKNSMNK